MSTKYYETILNIVGINFFTFMYYISYWQTMFIRHLHLLTMNLINYKINIISQFT